MSMEAVKGTMFPFGKIAMTPGVAELVSAGVVNPALLLDRHGMGDWSELSADDRAENIYAVNRELRVFSSFALTLDVTVWVITESDRSATTLLLPSEY